MTSANWCDDFTGTVTLEVTDSEFTASDTADVTVNNLAPVIDELYADQTVVYVGDTVYITGKGKDPGCDNLTIEWEGGDALYQLYEDQPPAYDMTISHQQ